MKVHTNTRNLIYISAITDAFLDQKRVNVCEHVVMMACIHIHLLSSDRERHLWPLKYIVSVCLYVAVIRRFLHFSVRVFPFFSYLLCYPYFVLSFQPGLWYIKTFLRKIWFFRDRIFKNIMQLFAVCNTWHALHWSDFPCWIQLLKTQIFAEQVQNPLPIVYKDCVRIHQTKAS